MRLGEYGKCLAYLMTHRRPLLEKIASQVKPIMAKRSWHVGTLAEVCSSDRTFLTTVLAV